MEQLQSFVELLQAMQSTDREKRRAAEQLYEESKARDTQQLCLGLLIILSTKQLDGILRQHASVLLRQFVTRRGSKDFVFARVGFECKANVAAELLRLFESEADMKVQRSIGEVVAKLAESCCQKRDQNGWITSGSPGWPALLPACFRIVNGTHHSGHVACEGLRLLTNIVPFLKDELIQSQQDLGKTLQQAFASSDTSVKGCALLLVCAVVACVESKFWKPLTATLPVLCQVIQQAALARMEEEVQECLQALVDVVESEPDFFKLHLASTLEPAKTLAALVRARELEIGCRNLALEWLVSYIAQKPKWLAKCLPALPALTIECCMELMLEIDGGDEDLQEWIERLDDEEGEEDADEPFHAGEEAIERVMEAMRIDCVGPIVLAVVRKYAEIESWQAKHAAFAALRQTVDFVEDRAHIRDMTQLLLAHLRHPHPRVRFKALQAIGRLATGHSPYFQDVMHQTVVPQLLDNMDDPVDRVAAMAISSFVSFTDEFDRNLLLQYVPGVMQSLVRRLQESGNRLVRKAALSAISMIALVLDKNFSAYYDGMMPLLKQIVLASTSDKENGLRGKAFECMSLLGPAVDKAKFFPDARDAVFEMATSLSKVDEVQRNSTYAALERICACLKDDFTIFLPLLLPHLFLSLKLQSEDVAEDAHRQLQKVSTAKYEEAMECTSLLCTFCSEMEGAYLDWVTPTAAALLPFLNVGESTISGQTRSPVFTAWAALIKCARLGAHRNGVDANLSSELLQSFFQKSFVMLEQEQDEELLCEVLEGISQCLRALGPQELRGSEVLQIVRKVLHLTDQSSRPSGAERRVGKELELTRDEDEEDHGNGVECSLGFSCQEMLGVVMQVAPAEFIQVLPEVGHQIQQLLASTTNHSVTLYLFCNLVKHLGEQSQALWPMCMPLVFEALAHNNPELRIPAAKVITSAAALPLFTEAAAEAFHRVSQICAEEPKRREERNRVAQDVAVSALLALAANKSAYCPADLQPWPLIVCRLPLLSDKEEAKIVHKTIAELVLAENPGLLCQGGVYLGRILSALAEVYEREELCEHCTDELIRKIVHLVPQPRLCEMRGSFSEKQMRKIEGMLPLGVEQQVTLSA